MLSMSNAMEENTTLWVKKDTRDEIMKFKYEEGHSSVDDLINALINEVRTRRENNE